MVVSVLLQNVSPEFCAGAAAVTAAPEITLSNKKERRHVMAKVSETYSALYSTVEQWPEEPTTFKIVGCGVEKSTFDNRKGELQIWIELADFRGRVRVNKTNAVGLVEAWGDEIEGWLGNVVQVSRVRQNVMKELKWCGVITPILRQGKGKK